MTSRETEKCQYIPALDGVRALAVALVFLFHFEPTRRFGGAGTMGVDLFFVLSGFLITSILLKEREQLGRISLGAFCWRRILRIWPALFFLLAIYAMIALIGSERESADFFAIAAAGLSLMNWVTAFDLGPVGLIPHTWSLAIEEQFYLVWPAMLGVFLSRHSRRDVRAALYAVIAFSVLWRIYLGSTGATAVRLYTGIDTHIDPIVMGCLLALGAIPRHWAKKFSAIWPVPVAAIAVLSFARMWDDTWWFQWVFVLTGVLGVWVIVAAMDPNTSLSRALSTPAMVWLGKRSYGLYLWHYFVARLLDQMSLTPLYIAMLGVPISLVIAEFSYRYIEKPILRWKHWPKPAQHSEIAP